MEQNTNRLFWAVGVLSIGALLLGGGSFLVKENFLPKISQVLKKSLEDNDKNNVKGVEAADGYIVAKIRDEDKTKNESAIYIFLTKNADGTLTIDHAKEDEGEGPYLTASTGELYIPDKVNGADITAILSSAFSSANFTKLKLPENIKQIEPWSFTSSPLIGELSLPESIESIGESAFSEAKLSGKLILPSKLKEIGSWSFLNSKFTGELVLPENIKSIGDYTFRDSIFTGELNLPQNVENIGEGAFQNSIFTGTFETRSNLKTIGALAFQKSKFTGTLDLLNISTIDYEAFDSSLFTQVNNPRNLPTTEGTDVQEDSISHTAIRLSTGNYYLN